MVPLLVESVHDQVTESPSIGPGHPPETLAMVSVAMLPEVVTVIMSVAVAPTAMFEQVLAMTVSLKR